MVMILIFCLSVLVTTTVRWRLDFTLMQLRHILNTTFCIQQECNILKDVIRECFIRCWDRCNLMESNLSKEISQNVSNNDSTQ